MKSEIKMQMVKVLSMSREGRQRWNPAVRHLVRGTIFKAQRGITVPLTDINTEDKLANYVWLHYGPGRWQVRAPCPNKKARFGFSMKTLVELELRPDPTNEWRPIVHDWKEKRLGRYKKMLNWEGWYR